MVVGARITKFNVILLANNALEFVDIIYFVYEYVCTIQFILLNCEFIENKTSWVITL